jgi:hypothetical protein
MGDSPKITSDVDLHSYATQNYPDLFRADNTIDLHSTSARNFLTSYTSPQAFDKIGYARSLGGFFYEFFYAILSTALVALTFSQILGFLFPWPESRSMVDIAGILFVLLQTIFNVPTNYALDMFIGDYRIKDPPKMVQYIRFYIWYQMMSGVFLVTGLSYFVLNMLQTGDLVWAKWLMLILISREYPAFTGMFITIIRALQKFDIEAKLNFIKDTLVNNLCTYGFVLWGKYALGANPAIGPLFGIAIGYAIGTYVGEFVSMLIVMVSVRKVMLGMGFRFIELFIPYFGKDVIWRSLKFGFIVSIPAIISSFIGTMTTLWWYSYVPAYLTFITLSKLADDLANVIKAGGGINITATISEAINNGKKELTSYYISMIWKFVFFFKFAIGAIILSFIPLILNILLVAGGAENYLLAAAFITPNIIATLVEQPQDSARTVILGANRPTFNTVITIIHDVLNLGFIYLWLIVLRLPQTLGFSAVIWLIPLGGFAPGVLRMIVSWYYIHKQIAPVRFKEFFWQTFMAPIFPALIIAGVAQLWYFFVFENLIALLGGGQLAMILTGGISIMFAFIVCAMFIFFPLYGAFGGWDTNTMAIFDEAVRISGPSRFLFLPINKASHFFEKISPLHNRFPIPYEKALEEADELMQERFIKDKLTQELQGLGLIS